MLRVARVIGGVMAFVGVVGLDDAFTPPTLHHDGQPVNDHIQKAAYHQADESDNAVEHYGVGLENIE